MRRKREGGTGEGKKEKEREEEGEGVERGGAGLIAVSRAAAGTRQRRRRRLYYGPRQRPQSLTLLPPPPWSFWLTQPPTALLGVEQRRFGAEQPRRAGEEGWASVRWLLARRAEPRSASDAGTVPPEELSTEGQLPGDSRSPQRPRHQWSSGYIQETAGFCFPDAWAGRA